MPVYVHGAAGGGKRSVLRDVLGSLGMRAAFIDCVTAAAPRSLYAGALNQLQRQHPSAANGYVGWSPCDSGAAFVAGLQEAIAEHGRVVLVMHSCEQLLAAPALRKQLLSLPALCHDARAQVVFIAEDIWADFHTTAEFAPLIPVHFGPLPPSPAPVTVTLLARPPAAVTLFSANCASPAGLQPGTPRRRWRRSSCATARRAPTRLICGRNSSL